MDATKTSQAWVLSLILLFVVACTAEDQRPKPLLATTIREPSGSAMPGAVGSAHHSSRGTIGRAPGRELAGHGPVSRVVLSDGPGDVLAGEYPYKKVARVRRPTVDIVRAVARHGPSGVMVRIQFANLRRVDADHDFVFAIGTPRGLPLRYWLTIVSSAHQWRGRVVEFEDVSNDHLIACPGLIHDIGYATDVVTVRVPRKCVGTPAWVRVHIENGLQGPETDVMDSAHDRDLKFGEAWPPRSTPRLSPPDMTPSSKIRAGQ